METELKDDIIRNKSPSCLAGRHLLGKDIERLPSAEKGDHRSQPGHRGHVGGPSHLKTREILLIHPHTAEFSGEGGWECSEHPMLCDTDRESHRCCPKSAELWSECKFGPGSPSSICVPEP